MPHMPSRRTFLTLGASALAVSGGVASVMALTNDSASSPAQENEALKASQDLLLARLHEVQQDSRVETSWLVTGLINFLETGNHPFPGSFLGIDPDMAKSDWVRHAVITATMAAWNTQDISFNPAGEPNKDGLREVKRAKDDAVDKAFAEYLAWLPEVNLNTYFDRPFVDHTQILAMEAVRRRIISEQKALGGTPPKLEFDKQRTIEETLNAWDKEIQTLNVPQEVRYAEALNSLRETFVPRYSHIAIPRNINVMAQELKQIYGPQVVPDVINNKPEEALIKLRDFLLARPKAGPQSRYELAARSNPEVMRRLQMIMTYLTATEIAVSPPLPVVPRRRQDTPTATATAGA